MNIISALSSIGSGLVQGTFKTLNTLALVCFGLGGLVFFFSIKHFAIYVFYALSGNAMLPLFLPERHDYLWANVQIERVGASYDPIEEETGIALVGGNTSGIDVTVLAVCTVNSRMTGSSKQARWVIIPNGAVNGVFYGGTGNTTYTGPISSQHCTVDEIRTYGAWWEPKQQG